MRPDRGTPPSHGAGPHNCLNYSTRPQPVEEEVSIEVAGVERAVKTESREIEEDIYGISDDEARPPSNQPPQIIENLVLVEQREVRTEPQETEDDFYSFSSSLSPPAQRPTPQSPQFIEIPQLIKPQLFVSDSSDSEDEHVKVEQTNCLCRGFKPKRPPYP